MRSLFIAAGTLILCSIPGFAQTDRKITARPGLFKPLNEPPCSYCSTQNRKGLIRPGDPVIAWLRAVHNGGAIPLRHFLSGPRVINDTYGLFFYDPDGGYVSAFRKDYGYDFYGWRDGVMVVKGKDGTLWSALTGAAISGPQKGARLERIPNMITTWSHWLMLHPESTAYDLFDGKKYSPVDLPTTMHEEARKSMGRVDPRLDAMRTVLGVEVGQRATAFPVDEREERACFMDRVGEKEVAVFWYGLTRTAVAFETALEGRKLTFYADDISPETAPFKDKETGTRWTLAGRGIDGPLRGKELTWVKSVQCRWYAWAAEYPETAVHVPHVPEAGTGGRSGIASKASTTSTTTKGELLDANGVTSEVLARIKRENGNTVAIRVEDGTSSASARAAAGRVRTAGLRLYYWLDIGRNAKLADAHPEWMASLQGHPEWRRHHPNLREAKDGEVVKNYPWVPVRYEPAFAAHVERLKRLLQPLPKPDGLFLNHLQAAPSACGCGNLLCRWTPDYGPVKTAPYLPNTAAAQFVAAAQRAVPGADVVPVWMSECEEHEMPRGAACDGVPCFSGTCWYVWSDQLRHVGRQARTIAALTPYLSIGRSDAQWVGRAVASFSAMPPKRDGESISPDRLIAVLQGWDVRAEEIEAQRKSAQGSGAGGYLIARTPIDQSWQPRIVQAAGSNAGIGHTASH